MYIININIELFLLFFFILLVVMIVYIFGHGNSNKLVQELCADSLILAKGLFQLYESSCCK